MSCQRCGKGPDDLIHSSSTPSYMGHHYVAGPLSFHHLREQNFMRCQEKFYPIMSRHPAQWISKLVEEVGEVAQLVNRLEPNAKGVLTEEQIKQDLARELGDVQTYLDLLAARFGIDLGEAVREKFNIVSDRVGSPRKL